MTVSSDIQKLQITADAQRTHFYQSLVECELRITAQVSYLQKSLLYEERNLNVSSVTIDRVSQFYPSKDQAYRMSFDQLKTWSIESITADCSNYVCHLSFGFPGGI